ncbi:MAG: tetratricopeptide repeat protein [Ignavibacteriae bacterium]|nr:tetratricopeptide repeat protein [Ignavibacteriota bacterium]MCB9242571.1 tetratricopeptide repeat protein [Ignavibacteriales bacterium]
MKKKLLLVFFSMGIVVLLNSVSYTQTSLADSLRDAGNLDAAIEEYQRLYNTNPNDDDNTYDLAGALALNRQIDSAFHYLFIAVRNDTSVVVLSDPFFIHLIDDPRWSELEDMLIERVEKKLGKYSNVELSKELWRMRLKDQAYYYHINIAEKNGYGNLVRMALWDLKTRINEENVARLEEIISEYGIPKISYVKNTAAEAAFLIIQHADIKTQEKYLPMFIEAADSGEAHWFQVALMVDRVNIRTGKMQIYGTQLYQHEDGSYYVKDLIEPEYVNQRRAGVGLGPIQEYVKQWNVVWDIEQKEK